MPDLVEELADLAARVRARRPLIHYLPNWVTANDVANALLAFGASPIMAVASDEAADILSDALAINLGTPTPERMVAAEVAGRAVAERNIPIVLDPVGVGATPWRLTHAHRLVSAVPMTILRCNAGEASALLAFGVAGEVAARAATGPGSLRVALLDALYTLDETTYLRYGKARWS